jgi:hypothetical protein
MLNIYITQNVSLSMHYRIMCNNLQTKFMFPFCLVWKGYSLDERKRCQLKHLHNFLNKDCVLYSTCVATSATQRYVTNYYWNVVSKCCEYATNDLKVCSMESRKCWSRMHKHMCKKLLWTKKFENNYSYVNIYQRGW